MTQEQIKAINDAMSSLTTICGNYIHTTEEFKEFRNHHMKMMQDAGVPNDIWDHYNIIATSMYNYNKSK